jgi:hypothetical protein
VTGTIIEDSIYIEAVLKIHKGLSRFVLRRAKPHAARSENLPSPNQRESNCINRRQPRGSATFYTNHCNGQRPCVQRLYCCTDATVMTRLTSKPKRIKQAHDVYATPLALRHHSRARFFQTASYISAIKNC